MTLLPYAETWNRYCEATKLAVKTGAKADRDEADRLFALHHDLIRAEVKGQMECGPAPLPEE